VGWLRMAGGLYALQSGAKVRQLIQYRTDFFFGVLLTFGFSIMGPLFQFLIFTKTRGYPGWTFDQMLVLQGVLLTSTGICNSLLGGVRQQIDQLVQRGELDRLLLKPFPPLMLVLTGGFSPYAVGTIVLGIVVLSIACARAGIVVLASSIGLFLVMLTAGVTLFAAAVILYATLSVRWVYTGRLGEIIDKVLQFGEFPSEIYPPILSTVFMTILPLTVFAYWPAQALLGRLGPMAWVALAGAITVCTLAALGWRGQLRRYTSAGG
jgi:ABC-2 type transport system permease protein